MSATSDDIAAQPLERLFAEYVQPWCREIARGALRKYALRSVDRTDQAEETESDVLLKVTARLRSVRLGTAEPISDLRAYIVTCVYNACFLRLRARAPERARLENRIRYLLRHDSGFASWDAGPETLAGFTRWKGREAHMEAAVPPFPARQLSLLLKQIFEAASGPVPLGSLIAAVAEVLGVADLRPVEFADSTRTSVNGITTEDTLDQVERLRRLWTEVLDLPANQRAALLLNLRDEEGQGVIELIPASGVASFEGLADALGMSRAKLTDIWDDLPIEDSRIAETLFMTRQQVINLRKSARARLARRFSVRHDNLTADSSSMSGMDSLRTAGRALRKVLGG